MANMRAKAGRLLRGAAAGAAAILLAAAAALGAPGEASRYPNYAIPNVAAIIMGLAVLVIPCRRFRHT